MGVSNPEKRESSQARGDCPAIDVANDEERQGGMDALRDLG